MKWCEICQEYHLTINGNMEILTNEWNEKDENVHELTAIDHSHHDHHEIEKLEDFQSTFFLNRDIKGKKTKKKMKPKRK